MKKLLFASAVFIGSIGLYSCDNNSGVTNNESDGTVISSDTTVSELEVERTTMDVDTTYDTNTETIDPQDNNNNR